MKVIKGMDQNMKCRGYQFAEGESYKEDKAKLCECGFHGVERPLDVFSYYPPASSVYHEAELEDVSDERHSDDSKVCGKKITIGARLSIRQLVDAHIQYTREHCTNKNNAEAGKPATAGYAGAATAGNRGAATAGEYGAATAGEYGAATAGNRGAATAGEYGAATAGNRGAATAGYAGAATSKGTACVGENGLAVARGNNCKVKGGMGSILVIAEENIYNCAIKKWTSVLVDGVKVKPDTWYCINENGDLVEADM